MPSKKKKYNARFPPARIKKIMQMDEEVGKVAATVPVIISRALELFIESLIQQATQTTLSKNAKTLSTSHIKQTIESQERYKFLRELVANVPDHQMDEEGGSSNHNNGEESSLNANQTGRRARGRPRKVKDGNTFVRKKERRKRKKESSESSESDNSEETEDAEDETDEESTSAAISSATTIPTTSVTASVGTSTTGSNSSNGDNAVTAAVPASPVTQPQAPSLSQPPGQLQQQEQQQLPQQAVPTTFQAPSMMPAAMPMYQSMPGAATPHLFNWTGSTSTFPPGILTSGFPSGLAAAQGFPGIQPQGGGFPTIPTARMGFPGIVPPIPGFPGLNVPGSGVSGIPSLGPTIAGMGPSGAVIPQAVAEVAGAPSGAEADDDYDT